MIKGRKIRANIKLSQRKQYCSIVLRNPKKLLLKSYKYKNNFIFLERNV